MLHIFPLLLDLSSGLSGGSCPASWRLLASRERLLIEEGGLCGSAISLGLASSSSLALGGGDRGGLGKRPRDFPPVLFVIGPCGLGHITSQPLLQRMKWPGEKQVCPRWAGEDERT